MLQFSIMLIISYLLGSMPTSIIAGKLLKNIDIREHGSGNAGATNVFRVLGWKAGLVVLIIDMLKGLIPTVWFAQLGTDGLGIDYIYAQICAGLAAVFGHIWTIFAGFKGGKGVGTGAGMIIGLAPLAVGICIGIFIVVVAITRYVSLGSILASLALVPVLLLLHWSAGQTPPVALLVICGFIAALIVFTHRSNIKRLLKGEENKINLQKSS